MSMFSAAGSIRMYGVRMSPDAELLRAFVEARDPEAFRQIVRRHADAVYSAALRQTGGAGSLADDVTQATFIMLARKAHRVNAAYLSGWLIKAARLAALQALRAQRRRQNHE